MRPSALGAAPCLAIERVVRAVGRIVVCVDAAAEVSTARIRSLSRVPSRRPRAEKAERVVRMRSESVDARERDRRSGDEHVDAQRDERRRSPPLAGRPRWSSVSSFTVTPLSQPQ